MKEILLTTPTMTGKIYVGTDALAKRLPALTRGQKNFVLTDSNVYALYPHVLETYFQNAEVFVLPAGEENKTFQSLYQILSAMAKAKLHRTSRLFALGGGVIGDIGGLASALYMRGISCVQIPTTLLSQVDSSVGGKTAVDLDGVKNIVGAFKQPMEVLIDPTFLTTLPARERKCGMGEIVKYAALSDTFFDTLCENTDKLNDLTFLSSLIEESVALKARVVEQDEKETGERKCLNVGHTTGHAIELFYGLSHGESVLYGAWIETKIAIAQGVCTLAYGEKLLKIFEKALSVAPTSTPDFTTVAQCLPLAKSDKKNVEDGKITMSVAKDKGRWTLLSLDFTTYVQAVEYAVKGGQV